MCQHRFVLECASSRKVFALNLLLLHTSNLEFNSIVKCAALTSAIIAHTFDWIVEKRSDVDPVPRGFFAFELIRIITP
jgi:hypothetical protein